MDTQEIPRRTDMLATLENMIDRTSIKSVLEALAEVAYGKSLHIEETWQDTATARPWQKAGRRLDVLASTMEV